MFGYIIINNHSNTGGIFYCRILSYDLVNKNCKIEINGNIFFDVPFDKLQPVNGSKLPWDVVVN